MNVIQSRFHYLTDFLVRLTVAVSVLMACTATHADSKITSPVTADSASTFIYLDRRENSTPIDSVESGHQAALLSDSCVSPSAPEHFRMWLVDTFPEQLSGSTVTLKQLNIEKVDAPVEVATGNYNPMLGAVGSLLGNVLHAAVTNLRGRYLVTVSIVGTVDGEEFSGKAEGIFRGDVKEQNVKDVMDYAAGKAYVAIKAALFVKGMREQSTQAN